MANIVDEMKVAQQKHVENCYLLRDTIMVSKHTKLLWGLLQQLLQLREAEVLRDMRDTTKSQPHFDQQGEQLGYTKVPMVAEDFFKLAGQSDGLRYLPEKVDQMMAKANKEDAKKEHEAD